MIRASPDACAWCDPTRSAASMVWCAPCVGVGVGVGLQGAWVQTDACAARRGHQRQHHGLGTVKPSGFHLSLALDDAACADRQPRSPRCSARVCRRAGPLLRAQRLCVTRCASPRRRQGMATSHRPMPHRAAVTLASNQSSNSNACGSHDAQRGRCRCRQQRLANREWRWSMQRARSSTA